MKITMYELLGMVKNGEAPKKIKLRTFELKRTQSSDAHRLYVDNDGMFFPKDYSFCLDDEVEILEEENKIPEEIKVKDYDKCIHDVTHKEKEFSLDIRELQIRYNDLLDYLKSKGE